MAITGPPACTESTKRAPSASAPLVTRWLRGQDTRNAPISSNQPALQLPFQRWFKLKEAFAPQLIIDCARSLEKFPQTCLDPFGGSGTTALTAQFLGIRPTTIELNPFLGDLIEAKLNRYNIEQLQADCLRVLTDSRELHSCPAELLKHGPPTLVEPGKDGRWIFPADVATRILALRETIKKIESPANRVLLNVVLGSTLLGLSNVIVNGKGRKYRLGWQTREKIAADVDTAFRGSFYEVLTDIFFYCERAEHNFTLIRGDSRVAIDLSDEVDFAVFSPPYPNSFDYTDIYNLELWMLGHLTTRPDNKRLRESTLRSHVQINRPYSIDTLNIKKLDRAYLRLCDVREQLWNRNIPEMVCAYFEDMRTVLSKLKDKVKKGGKVFLAVGNSKYAGVMVDTEEILKEIARDLGYNRVTSKSIRSMRSSAQQGGKRVLREALITLR